MVPMTYQSELPGGPEGRRGHSLRRALRRCRDDRGVAITEMALVLPLLLILLFGMIDFGKAINYWLDETHLANEGARLAVVDNWPGKSSGTTLQQYILSQVDSAELAGATATEGTPHSAQVCISFPNGTHNTGDPVTVTVKYDYNWLRYLFNQAGIGPVTTITGASTMRIEANLGVDASPYSAGCAP
jgi:Flp pilus assembly protein TadG